MQRVINKLGPGRYEIYEIPTNQPANRPVNRVFSPAPERVYFVWSPTEGVKIGVSKDPWHRMRSLGLPGLRLMATLRDVDPWGLEAYLHRRFGHLRRGKSEWFYPGGDLLSFIQEVKG